MNPHALDFAGYETTLLAMVLYKPSVLSRLTASLFDNPGNLAVFEAMARLHNQGEEITRESVQKAAGQWSHCTPESWFTVANIDFYLTVLEGRRWQKVRRAELLDELKAIEEAELGIF
jgi:replicative DNA helicase